MMTWSQWFGVDFWSDGGGTGAKIGPVSVNVYRDELNHRAFSVAVLGRYVIWPREKQES